MSAPGVHQQDRNPRVCRGLHYLLPPYPSVQQHQLALHRRRHYSHLRVWAPRHTLHRPPHLPRSAAPARGDLPQAHGTVGGAGGDPLAGGVHRHAAHLVRVPLKQHALPGGEGLEVLGLGQLGQQALGVHVDALLAGAGAQVQVQAPLKPLVDVVRVRRHLPKSSRYAGGSANDESVSERKNSGTEQSVRNTNKAPRLALKANARPSAKPSRFFLLIKRNRCRVITRETNGRDPFRYATGCAAPGARAV
eukprot:1194671-Prorocentrum_minimum.AAC.1